MLVDRPFTAQLPEKNKPKRGDGGGSQRGASKMAIAWCGYGLCLRENGIQSARTISQEPKDGSTARFVAALCERRILSAVADRRYRATDVFGNRSHISDNTDVVPETEILGCVEGRAPSRPGMIEPNVLR